MNEDDPNRLEALYARAVDIGAQARNWFDGPGIAWRATLPADRQAAAAIESLATTARLVGVMSWLLDPAQIADASLKPPAIADEGRDLPNESPLAGTQGGEIAIATRRLLADVTALAAGRTAGSARLERAASDAGAGDGPAADGGGAADIENLSMADYAGLWRQ